MFDGKTYDPSEDGDRLARQLERVKRLMLDGKWRTSAEMKEALGDEWSSINARLRDLRKEKFGSYIVDRERVKGGNGLHRYRVRPPENAAPTTLFELDAPNGGYPD